MAFEDMIILARGEKRFGVRVAAAIVHEGRVLLQTAENDDFWVLPGGHAEVGEPTIDCVAREMREELGEEVRLDRLLWVVDNFFRYGQADWHEIGFYWLASLAADSLLVRRECFPGIEESGTSFLCQWHDLRSLPAVRLYPSFLRDGLRALPETPRYVVHRDGA
jgi:ADP-ribose pyrophosphatase YjhB (NUDIX family)